MAEPDPRVMLFGDVSATCVSMDENRVGHLPAAMARHRDAEPHPSETHQLTVLYSASARWSAQCGGQLVVEPLAGGRPQRIPPRQNTPVKLDAQRTRHWRHRS